KGKQNQSKQNLPRQFTTNPSHQNTLPHQFTPNPSRQSTPNPLRQNSSHQSTLHTTEHRSTQNLFH
ncbi:335_t:CDS:1, partial [Gigaspora margarita]